MIFDCCFAGNLAPTIQGRGRIWPTRSFEYLAACPYNKLTHPPGRKSFTAALIWALESLLETRGRFTTHELQQKIMKEAPNFPRDQIVEVQERGQPCDQRLVLAPLTEPNSFEHGSGELNKPPLRNFIDLRVWYPIAPNEEEIEDFASIMRRVIVERKVTASNIAWVRFDHVDPVRKAIDKWQTLLSPSSRRKLKSASTNLTLDMSPLLVVNSHLQPPQTPPPSESGRHNMGYPPMQETQSEQGCAFDIPGVLEQDENEMELHENMSRISLDKLDKFEDDRRRRMPADILNEEHWINTFTAWMCQPTSLVTFAAVYICVDHLVLRRSLSYRPA